MAFTVEDGSIVENANSYISLADARAYALDRNLTLPTDDTECEQALVRGADYIDGYYSGRFQGRTVDEDQTMAWPRYPVYIEGRLISYTSIPAQVKAAQVHAAVAIADDIELEPAATPAPVIREKVGSLETEYASTGGSGSIVPRVTAVERLLRPYLIGSGRVVAVRI